MFCACCGFPIPKGLEEKSTEYSGKGREGISNKTFIFTFTFCTECDARLNRNLASGEEGAFRRKFELSLFDKGLTKEQMDEELKKFDSKTFGGEPPEVFGHGR
jgi:hypothetical protein